MINCKLFYSGFQWKRDLFCDFFCCCEKLVLIQSCCKGCVWKTDIRQIVAVFCFFKLWKQQGVQGIVYLREKEILFRFQKKDFAIEKADPAGSKAGDCFNLVSLNHACFGMKKSLEL